MMDETIRLNGEVPLEQIESLERLARLVNVSNTAQIKIQKRWPFALALGISLIIVSMLLFARVRETEIELNLMVSEVGFELSTHQVLTNPMTLPELGVSGLRKIEIPRSLNRDSERWGDADDQEFSVRFFSMQQDNETGAITLSTLALPEKTRIFFRSQGPANEARLSLVGNGLSLQVAINGHVRINRSSGLGAQFDFGAPTSIELAPAEEQIDLDLTPYTPSFFPFAQQLNVQNLSLLRVDEFLTSERPILRRLSTVLEGTIFFESLNGQQQKLRQGELIQFEHSTGEIRTIGIREGRIELTFHGHVRGMYTGSGENRISLMPTWLDWLRARHGLSLLWGTTIYLFGMMLAVLRWWRGSE